MLIISAAVLIGKVLTCALGTFLAGHDRRTSLRVGMGLAQIGEFSFIIAASGPFAERHQRFPVSHRRRGLRAHHAADPASSSGADRVADGLDRVAPKPLLHTLNLYTRWIGQLGDPRRANLARRLIGRWLAQMAFDVR